MRTSVAHALGLSALLVVGCAAPETANDGESAAPGSAASGASQEGKDWNDLSLEEQKDRYLVDQYLQGARNAMDQSDLEGAADQLEQALALDPDNAEARELFARVNRQRGAAGGSQDTAEERALLRKQQAEADARQNIAEAKLLFDRGEYSAAAVELKLALDIITLSPWSDEWTDLEQEARTMLETVTENRDRLEAERREQEQRKAREELIERERAEQQYRRNVVRGLLDQAVDAFDSEDYDDAISLSDRVLRLDPRNEMARNVRDSAFRASRDLVREEFLQNKRKQYARWQEQQEELRIPYQDVIQLPDAETWGEITAMRASRRSLAGDTRVSAGDRELRKELAGKVLDGGFELDGLDSLSDVAQLIATSTSLPIVVDPEAEDANEGEFTLDLAYAISVEEALNIITEMAGPEVTWTVRHETILITTVQKAAGELVIHNHDISDIIFPLNDFLGPRIDRVRLADELEDDDGGSPFGAVGEQIVQLEADKLDELIRNNIAPETWDGGLEGAEMIVEDNGSMIVTHTPEVHRQIRQFLADLREFRSSLVTIESKFMTINEGWLQEIGVDWRGLDGSQTGAFSDLDDIRLGDAPAVGVGLQQSFFESPPTKGLDNSGDGVTLTPPSAGAFLDDGLDGSFAGRTENFFNNPLGSALSTVGGMTAQWTLLDDLELSMILNLVEKSADSEIINEQILSVSNRQRAYVTVVNQRAYVQDFDVEVAQFQAIADPVINTLIEGIVLDVRPTIDNSRKYLTLEIQPTVTSVISLVDFSTTLAGQTAAVTLQLPEVETQSVFTTAVVPDGGSILLGGLSRIRNIERRAEVPFLAKIPVLGFFFKEEGYNDERESLMIMLRAWITDPAEEFESEFESL